MPTVLYVSQPTITGVAQCVLDWTSGLSQRGWDVALACPTDGWLGMACAREGVRTFAWEAVRQPYVGVRRETTRLRQIMNIVRPDVVHLQGSKAGLSGRLLLRGSIPTAFSPHSWSFEAADGAIGAAALRWERVATRWTDVVVAVSEAECADGLANGIDVPYVVARNGIDTTAVAPLAEADRETLRAELGIAPGTTAVVCLGRLHRQKGQDVLLAAWPAAVASGCSGATAAKGQTARADHERSCSETGTRSSGLAVASTCRPGSCASSTPTRASPTSHGRTAMGTAGRAIRAASPVPACRGRAPSGCPSPAPGSGAAGPGGVVRWPRAAASGL